MEKALAVEQSVIIILTRRHHVTELAMVSALDAHTPAGFEDIKSRGGLAGLVFSIGGETVGTPLLLLMVVSSPRSGPFLSTQPGQRDGQALLFWWHGWENGVRRGHQCRLCPSAGSWQSNYKHDAQSRRPLETRRSWTAASRVAARLQSTAPRRTPHSRAPASRSRAWTPCRPSLSEQDAALPRRLRSSRSVPEPGPDRPRSPGPSRPGSAGRPHRRELARLADHSR